MKKIEKQVALFQENLSGMLAIEEKIAKAVSKFKTELETLKQKDVEMREAIKVAMRENDIKKFESEALDITYVAESKRVIIDTAKLKAELPELWDKYSKESVVKDSVRIKLK